jgi:hypothetical protein
MGNKRHDCVVYFIRLGDLIKIGYTTNLPKRLESFRTTVLVEQRDILLIVRGTRKLEKQCHDLFADYRLRNELFK